MFCSSFVSICQHLLVILKSRWVFSNNLSCSLLIRWIGFESLPSVAGSFLRCLWKRKNSCKPSVVNKLLNFLCMNGFIMCRCLVQFYKFLWVNKSHHYCVTRNEAWTNAIRKKKKNCGFFFFFFFGFRTSGKSEIYLQNEQEYTWRCWMAPVMNNSLSENKKLSFFITFLSLCYPTICSGNFTTTSRKPL